MDEDNDIVIALRRGEDGWEYAAADEIEALRAENAKLREALKRYEDEADSLRSHWPITHD